jgi:Transposase DDE domain
MQDQSTTLLNQLQPHLTGWHLARQKFLVQFMLALLKAKTVNLTHIAPLMSGVEVSSNYRRIQRFLQQFTLEFDLVARLIWALLPHQPPYRLSLDRTNWQFKHFNINILTLAVITPNGLAIPLLWQMLDKAGNSNQPEREHLLGRFVDLFGVDALEHLLADREFIGSDWFAFLIRHRLPFFIRLRQNQWATQPGKGPVKLFWLFNDLALNQSRLLYKPVLLGTEWVYLSGVKRVNEQGQVEWVIVASYRFDADSLTHYRQRWQIESLFKALKTSGFHLEATHLSDLDRIEKLLALVALTYLWAYKVGDWLHEQKPITRRSHQRLAQSVFRLGLDALTRAVEFKPDLFAAFVLLLSCT